MQVKCNICGSITSKQGMSGHFRFKHSGLKPDYTEITQETQEKQLKGILMQPKEVQVGQDFNNRFNKLVEMAEKEAYLRYLKNFGKPEQPQQQTNSFKEILEIMNLLKQQNPSTPIKDIMQTVREMREFSSEFNQNGDNAEQQLLGLLPAVLSMMQQKQQQTEKPVLPQPIAQPEPIIEEEKTMDIEELANDILNLVPEKYKNDIKEDKYTLDQVKKMAQSNFKILDSYFRRMYDEPLTLDLLNNLIEIGYKNLKK